MDEDGPNHPAGLPRRAGKARCTWQYLRQLGEAALRLLMPDLLDAFLRELQHQRMVSLRKAREALLKQLSSILVSVNGQLGRALAIYRVSRGFILVVRPGMCGAPGALVELSSDNAEAWFQERMALDAAYPQVYEGTTEVPSLSSPLASNHFVQISTDFQKDTQFSNALLGVVGYALLVVAHSGLSFVNEGLQAALDSVPLPPQAVQQGESLGIGGLGGCRIFSATDKPPAPAPRRPRIG
jgi:hypothetical protein